MPNKKSSNNAPLDAGILFSCYANGANKVCLSGTFNSWNPESHPMYRDDEGNWRTTVPLASGHYEYKYVVDGVWCSHPGCHDLNVECPDCIKNDFDTMNQVIEVR